VGNFYTNITLQYSNTRDVVDQLRAESRRAYVVKSGEFVVVYDAASESQDVDVLSRLAADLSKRFACPALAALVHDDDIFACYLYSSGKEIDRYDSNPGYFRGKDVPPAGGDASQLIRTFGSTAAASVVQEILHSHSPPTPAPEIPKDLKRRWEAFQSQLQKIGPLAIRDDPEAHADLIAAGQQLSQEYFRAYTGAADPRGPHRFAHERHRALVNALGLPDCAVATGYNYLEEGEFPHGLSGKDFEKV
jgi:hypothetical protein